MENDSVPLTPEEMATIDKLIKDGEFIESWTFLEESDIPAIVYKDPDNPNCYESTEKGNVNNFLNVTGIDSDISDGISVISETDSDILKLPQQTPRQVICHSHHYSDSYCEHEEEDRHIELLTEEFSTAIQTPNFTKLEKLQKTNDNIQEMKQIVLFWRYLAIIFAIVAGITGIVLANYFRSISNDSNSALVRRIENLEIQNEAIKVELKRLVELYDDHTPMNVVNKLKTKSGLSVKFPKTISNDNLDIKYHNNKENSEWSEDDGVKRPIILSNKQHDVPDACTEYNDDFLVATHHNRKKCDHKMKKEQYRKDDNKGSGNKMESHKTDSIKLLNLSDMLKLNIVLSDKTDNQFSFPHMILDTIVENRLSENNTDPSYNTVDVDKKKVENNDENDLNNKRSKIRPIIVQNILNDKLNPSVLKSYDDRHDSTQKTKLKFKNKNLNIKKNKNSEKLPIPNEVRDFILKDNLSHNNKPKKEKKISSIENKPKYMKDFQKQDGDSDWYEKMMKHRETLRSQNAKAADKLNWYLKRGSEREKDRLKVKKINKQF